MLQALADRGTAGSGRCTGTPRPCPARAAGSRTSRPAGSATRADGSCAAAARSREPTSAGSPRSQPSDTTMMMPLVAQHAPRPVLVELAERVPDPGAPGPVPDGLGDLAQCRVRVAAPQHRGDPRQPRAEGERLHADAGACHRVAEPKQQPGVALHGAARCRRSGPRSAAACAAGATPTRPGRRPPRGSGAASRGAPAAALAGRAPSVACAAAAARAASGRWRAPPRAAPAAVMRSNALCRSDSAALHESGRHRESGGPSGASPLDCASDLGHLRGLGLACRMAVAALLREASAAAARQIAASRNRRRQKRVNARSYGSISSRRRTKRPAPAARTSSRSPMSMSSSARA